MDQDEYLERRKELVAGHGRQRSKMYPLLIGVFVIMIVINVAMLAINNIQ